MCEQRTIPDNEEFCQHHRIGLTLVNCYLILCLEVLLQLKLLNIENKRNRGDGWNGAHFTVLTCIVVHLYEITILVQSANKMETPLLEVIKKLNHW